MVWLSLLSLLEDPPERPSMKVLSFQQAYCWHQGSCSSRPLRRHSSLQNLCPMTQDSPMCLNPLTLGIFVKSSMSSGRAQESALNYYVESLLYEVPSVARLRACMNEAPCSLDPDS